MRRLGMIKADLIRHSVPTPQIMDDADDEHKEPPAQQEKIYLCCKSFRNSISLRIGL